MCPSYQATREEKDSTRGRARVLQDAVTGRLEGGWDSPALEEALDLCLACKGCARDCPTGVDMATYKAEWLHQKYAGKRRPRTHYSLGRLPAAGRQGAAAAGQRRRCGWLRRWASCMAGVDRRRSLPRLAVAAGQRAADAPVADRRRRALGRHLHQPVRPRGRRRRGGGAGGGRRSGCRCWRYGDECCGLTWISTGQLERGAGPARPGCSTGWRPTPCRTCRWSRWSRPAWRCCGSTPPSCSPTGPRRSPRGCVTLAEHLARCSGWAPPDLAGIEVVAQPHCHHASVLGWAADEALLRRAGATLTRVGGCCGLAGNFGMEKGHYEVSVAVFEHDLGPAVRAPAGTPSCSPTASPAGPSSTDLAGRAAAPAPGRAASPTVGAVTDLGPF